MSIEPMNDLANELLAVEKAKPAQPSAEAAQRLLERLEATLALPPLVPPAPPAPPPAPAAGAAGSAAAVVAGTGIKLGTGLAMMAAGLVVGSAATVVFLERPSPVVIEVPVSAPAPLPANPEVAEPQVAAPVPEPARPPTARKVNAAPLSKLAAEQPLLDIARSAIVSGRAQAALAALGRHARDFPDGELAEEREALLVQALAQSGDLAAAAARADAFRKRFPQSIFAPSVDAASPP